MFPFCSFLLLVLLHVELLKVLGDDGDGQRHDEDPGDGAQGPDELPEAGGGVDVSVPHCGHGDHHPVERVGDGGVLCVLLLPLDEVAERGEEQARDADEQDQQTELLVTVLQGEGTFQRCTFRNNTAKGSGGAIFVRTCDPQTVQNSIFITGFFKNH